MYRRRRRRAGLPATATELTAERFVPDPFGAAGAERSTARATSRAGSRTASSSTSAESTTRSRSADSGSSWARSKRSSQQHPDVDRCRRRRPRGQPPATSASSPTSSTEPRATDSSSSSGHLQAPPAGLHGAGAFRPAAESCRSPPTARSTAGAPGARARSGQTHRRRTSARARPPSRESPTIWADALGVASPGVDGQLLRYRRPLAQGRPDRHGDALGVRVST